MYSMSNNNNIISSIANYIEEAKYEDLPNKVIDKVKDILLDTIGVGLSGFRTKPAQIMINVIKDLGGKKEATIFGDGTLTNCAYAGYVNTYLVDVLDYEETYEGLCHPNASVIPAALAVGERVRTTGRNLINSIVVGNEVAIRVGLAMMPTRKVTDLGINAYTWHCMGSAASASKLLNLNRQEIVDAIGITASNTGLPTTITRLGRPASYVKNNFQRMTESGILGSLMAAKGFIGHRNILDHDAGFWRMSGSDRYDKDKILKDLGKQYKILKISFKPYPACRWIHTTLDAVQKIISQNSFNPEEIKVVKVTTVEDLKKYFVDYTPKSLVDAEFSIPYTVAMLLLGYSAGLDWFSDETLNNSDVLTFAKKVKVYSTQKADKYFHKDSANMANSTVEILLKSGKRFIRALKLDNYSLLGSPNNPIDLKEKFKDCANSAGMKKKAIENILHSVEDLDSLADVSELTKLLKI